MWCRSVRRKLVPYLDGALRDRRERALTRHLDRCARCRGEATQIRRILSAAAGPPPVASPHLETRIMAAVREMASEKALSSGRALGWVRVLAPVGVLAGLLGGLYLVRSVGEPMPAGPPAIARAPHTEQLAAPNARRGLPEESRVAARSAPQEVPPELVEDVDFFVNFPVIRDLDALAAFEAMSGADGGGGQSRIRYAERVAA